MPRLFTAIEMPAETAQSLALVRGGLPGARWLESGDYHATLRFIGDVDGRTAEEVADALGRVRRPAFTTELVGLDAFGAERPHALIARVKPVRELIELQAEQERIMQRLGLPAEGRKYAPHVTLARLRGFSSRQVADYLAVRGGYRSMPFQVGQFVLMSSRDSVGGGPYVVEAEYPLADGVWEGGA